MKICKHCGVEKLESEFNRDKSKKDGLSSWCKSCVLDRSKMYRKEHSVEVTEYNKQYRVDHKDKLSAYMREYRVVNREKLNEHDKEYSKHTRVTNKERLYSYKQPCVKCGEDRLYVIDFHHIDPKSKSFNISTVGSHYSTVDISKEVEKCVCLCRNCHTEFHHFYGNKPKEPVKAICEYLGRNLIDILEGDHENL